MPLAVERVQKTPQPIFWRSSGREYIKTQAVRNFSVRIESFDRVRGKFSQMATPQFEFLSADIRMSDLTPQFYHKREKLPHIVSDHGEGRIL